MPRQNVNVFILLEVVLDFEKVGVLSHCLQGFDLIHKYRFLLRLRACRNAIHSKEVTCESMADHAPLAHPIVREDVLHVQVLVGSRGEILGSYEVLDRFLQVLEREEVKLAMTARG